MANDSERPTRSRLSRWRVGAGSIGGTPDAGHSSRAVVAVRAPAAEKAVHATRPPGIWPPAGSDGHGVARPAISIIEASGGGAQTLLRKRSAGGALSIAVCPYCGTLYVVCGRAVPRTDTIRRAGLEPTTFGLEIRCSIQLSYRRSVREGRCDPSNLLKKQRPLPVAAIGCPRDGPTTPPSDSSTAC